MKNFPSAKIKNAFPFICTSVIKEHASKYADIYPTASKKLIEDIFIDDLVTGAETEKEAYALHYTAKEIMKTANFELQNWQSNSPLLQKEIQNENCDEFVLNTNKEMCHVLGVSYNSDSDTFHFLCIDLDQELAEKEATKRMVASIGYRVFDPLGFISPFILQIKILIQNLWNRGCQWDEALPKDLMKTWTTWLGELPHLNSLKIQRKLIPKLDFDSLELHIFGDAYESAFGAVAYLRTTYGNENYVKMIASKARTAPIRPVKLPRLELMAAVIAARLAKTIAEDLNLEKDIRKYYWSDSEIALHGTLATRGNGNNSSQTEWARFKQFLTHLNGDAVPEKKTPRTFVQEARV